MVYSIQGTLNGGSLSFSKQPSQLGSGNSDSYTVTASGVPGGFQAGQTYTGSITLSSTGIASVVIPVTVTVPATVQVFSGPFSGSGVYYLDSGETGNVSYSGTGEMTVTPLSTGGYSIHITTPTAIEGTTNYGSFTIPVDDTVTDPTFSQFAWTNLPVDVDPYGSGSLAINGSHTGSTVSGQWSFSGSGSYMGVGIDVTGQGNFSLTLQ